MSAQFYNDLKKYNQTLDEAKNYCSTNGGPYCFDSEEFSCAIKWDEEKKNYKFFRFEGEENSLSFDKAIVFSTSTRGYDGFQCFRDDFRTAFPDISLERNEMDHQTEDFGVFEVKESDGRDLPSPENDNKEPEIDRVEDANDTGKVKMDGREVGTNTDIHESRDASLELKNNITKTEEHITKRQPEKSDSYEVVRVMPTFSSKKGLWNSVKALGRFIGELILIFLERILLGREVFSMMYREAYNKAMAQELREEYHAQHIEKDDKEQYGPKKEIGKKEVKVEHSKEVEAKASPNKDEIIQPPYIRDPRSTERVGKEMYFRDQAVLAEDMYKLHVADVLAKAIQIPSTSIHVENTEHDGRPFMWITIEKGDSIIEQFGINDAGNAVDSSFAVRNERKTELSFANKCTEILSRDYSHNWRGASSMPSTAASKYYISKFINEMARQVVEREDSKVLGKISNVPAAISYDSEKDTYLLIVGTKVVLKDASRETLYTEDTAIKARKAIVTQQQIQQTYINNDIEQNGFFNGIDDTVREKFEGLLLEETREEEIEIADEREEELDFERE